MMRKTGIVTDAHYLGHVPEEHIPERPARLASIYRNLTESRLITELTSLPAVTAAPEDILKVHTPEYFQRIASTAGRDQVILTPDTMTSAGSFDAAMLAAGGFCAAVAAVLEGRVDNAFALVRPPGHHAERSRAMGYCLFNNVAIGATFARRAFGISRILIVDWDVHHGNGTQHIFEDDSGVFFFSTHQFPHFPGTGHFTSTGRGRGEGYTMNVPLPKGYGDGEYAAIYADLLPPLVEAYQPEIILVSAGFDTHRLDPMGAMNMSEDGFAVLTRCLMSLADQFCGGRLALVLEGGYHIETLGGCVDAVLREMSDKTHARVAACADTAQKKKVNYAVSRCRHVHQRYWKNLKAA
ncbi:MAG: histone deacetylase [Pseudomonadota bacterium]